MLVEIYLLVLSFFDDIFPVGAIHFADSFSIFLDSIVKAVKCISRCSAAVIKV